jgi:polar amino acid transport system permease protein
LSIVAPDPTGPGSGAHRLGWRLTRKALSLALFLVVLGLVLVLRTPLKDMRWDVLVGYRDFLLRALLISWAVTLASFALSVVPAGVLAFGRLSRNLLARYVSTIVVEAVRSIPQLMMIFWIFFTVPVVVGHGLDKYTSGIIALAVVNSAYLAEAIRAGIQSVPPGLSQAGLAGGLTPLQVRFNIILPIALRNILPELRNLVISLFKATSLLYVIGVIEFFNALQMMNDREFVPFPAMITAGFVYFGCTYLFELSTRWVEKGRGVSSGV